MYEAEVPAAEVSAADQAFDLVNTQLDTLQTEAPDWYRVQGNRYRTDAALAISQARAQQGRTGRPALDAFWEAADELAEIASAIGA